MTRKRWLFSHSENWWCPLKLVSIIIYPTVRSADERSDHGAEISSWCSWQISGQCLEVHHLPSWKRQKPQGCVLSPSCTANVNGIVEINQSPPSVRENRQRNYGYASSHGGLAPILHFQIVITGYYFITLYFVNNAKSSKLCNVLGSLRNFPNYGRFSAHLGQDASRDLIATCIRPEPSSTHVRWTRVQLKGLIYRQTSRRKTVRDIFERPQFRQFG